MRFNKSDDVLNTELDLSNISMERIDGLSEVSSDLDIIKYNIAQLDTGLRFYEYIDINGLDLNYLNMLNNQFNMLSTIGMDIRDFKGLSERGVQDIATEGLIEFMRNVLINIWEYIKKMVKSISDYISSFFSDTQRSHTEAIITQFKTVFNLALSDTDLAKITIQSPDPKLLSTRFLFYSKAMDTIIQLHNTYSEDLNVADDHPYSELKKLLGLVDSNKMSGVRIDTIAKKLDITKPTNGLHTLKDFKDNMGSELNLVLDLILNLTESYKKQLEVVSTIRSECDIQISELKKNNTLDNDPGLKKKASYYAAMCTILNLININLIHDHHIFINTMTDAVKKVDSYKRQNLGK